MDVKARDPHALILNGYRQHFNEILLTSYDALTPLYSLSWSEEMVPIQFMATQCTRMNENLLLEEEVWADE